MNIRIVTAAIVAATAAALTAVGGHERTPLARTETTPALVTAGPADKDKTFELAQGGKVLVRLPAGPGGVKQWARVPSPLGPLTPVENRVEKTMRDGQVTAETFVFGYRAAGEGTTQLRFAGQGPGGQVSLQLTVKVVASELGRRLADLKGNGEHFALGINFVAPEDKAFTEVYLATANAILRGGNKTILHLGPGEVRRVIEALTDSGCLNQAVRYDMPLKKAIPTNKPSCVLTVLSQTKYMLHLELGWELDVLTRLDAIAAALDARNQAAFKKAVAPLEARRAEWSAQTAQTRPATREAGELFESSSDK